MMRYDFFRRGLSLVLAVLCLWLCACGRAQETESIETGDPGSDVTEIKKSLINSDYAVLYERDSMTAVAGLKADQRMYPASLTKLMTFIVAAEKASDLGALVEITAEIKNQYADASRVGIDVGDLMTVKQMLYALLLSSDTDAALGLATHIAGDEASFAVLMNQKAAEMGLENTHFVNVTGLHHEDHYSTPHELAAIMAYAVNMPLGRTILTTERYVTYLKYYKGGELTDYRMTFVNTTLGDRFASNNISTTTPRGHVVLGGKTGYTEEADRCLATLAQGADGKEYILITGHAGSSESSARDAVILYDTYIPKKEPLPEIETAP